MKVSELIEILEELRDNHDDPEVRLAVQPQYPLSHDIHTVRVALGRVWIAASQGHPEGEHPYAPQEAWEEGDEGDEEPCGVDGCDRLAWACAEHGGGD